MLSVIMLNVVAPFTLSSCPTANAINFFFD
jgi:hypothetical protein